MLQVYILNISGALVRGLKGPVDHSIHLERDSNIYLAGKRES